MMSADPVPWDNAASLTLSFAPDGTRIGSMRSELFATLDSVASSNEWQAAIGRAFQTWAQHAHINVGIVTDTGLPFGVAGPQHGDFRFGDIRVGAVPMSGDIMAVSIPHANLGGGTWSGDILFNSNAEFTSLNELFRVAVHEAGHVLGLEHNGDANSPMFDHLATVAIVPTAQDIASLQALYGVRHPDINEENDGNETVDDATRVRYEDSDRDAGATPLVVFGDIQNTRDADVFFLPNMDRYGGSITFEVRTRGLSQLVPKIQVMTREGRVLGRATATEANGEPLRITIDSDADEKYYLKVESADEGLNSTGAFAVISTFDELLESTAAEIDKVVRTAFHWWGLDEKSINDVAIRALFGDDEPDDLNDDLHEDDDVLNAIDLEPTSQSGRLVRYLAIGSLVDSIDVDHYQVRSAERLRRSEQAMTVVVEALEMNGLIPAIEILNDDGSVVTSTVMINGNGQYIARAEGIAPDEDYYVRVVAAPTSAEFMVGSYSVSVTFDGGAVIQTDLAAGALSADQPVSEFTLYVARTQLVSLSLSSSTASAEAAQAGIWTTIYNDQQQAVSALAAPVGELRSSVSILLTPGEYTLQVAAKRFDGSSLPDIAYLVSAELISDPIGPPVVDPNTIPVYTCPDVTGAFCYPGEIVSPNPYHVVPDPVPSIPTAVDVPFEPPADEWFWSQQFDRTNPLNAYDVNNDSRVSPQDVLVIVSDLMKRGTRAVPPPPVTLPYLDVNGDGMISPRDVVAVLGRLRSGAGEGEKVTVELASALSVDGLGKKKK